MEVTTSFIKLTCEGGALGGVGGRKDHQAANRPGGSTTTCSQPGVAHHLLDQLEEVAPFQGSKLRIIHKKRILEEHYFCSARRGLVARWRKELLSQAWDEKVKVESES